MTLSRYVAMLVRAADRWSLGTSVIGKYADNDPYYMTFKDGTSPVTDGDVFVSMVVPR